MVDFTLSPEQNGIRGMAKSFADNVLSTAAATYGRYPTQKERFQSLRPFYRKAVEGGLVYETLWLLFAIQERLKESLMLSKCSSDE
jgi:hypothetical protein